MAKLCFYYSAMNAGKSTMLLQSDYNYRECGMKTLLFTSSLDDRYKVGQITSRIGLSAPAFIFDESFDFVEFVKDYKDISCILVDEAQFLKKEQVYQLAYIVDNFDIPVLTYGLRSDFLGNPFEGSLNLLTLADVLSELKTMCFCGRKAIMNARINESGEKVTCGNQIEIGGEDKYISLCRKHYMNYNSNKRVVLN